MTDDHASPFYGKDRIAAYREEAPRKVPERLPLVTPEQEAMLREAGFKNIELFHAAVSFPSPVATA